MGLSEHASAALRRQMREQQEQQAAMPQQMTKEELEKQRKLNELLAANVVFASASLGGPAKTAAEKTAPKPYVRHIVVKDLRRVAHNMNISIPETNLFANRSPIALFALFDGQSCADIRNPGSQAAEWCCRNIHTKLLKNISSLAPQQTQEMGVNSMLRSTLAELDQELILEQIGIHDGCGASLALLIGDQLFIAAIGSGGILLCLPPAQEVGGSKASGAQPRKTCPDVRSIGDNQGRFEKGTQLPRSLGDRAWKHVEGMPLRLAQATCSSHKLSYQNGGITLLLTSSPISENLPLEQVSESVKDFQHRPRAVSGDVAVKACERANVDQLAGGTAETIPQQFTAVTVYFLPPKEIPEELRAIAPKSANASPSQPPAKKQRMDGSKAETNSVRLRNILVRHSESRAPFDPVRQKPVFRQPTEADATLRKALHELLQEQALIKVPSDPKKAALVHLQPSPKCIALTKQISECESAQKAGMVCGDLEWMTSVEMRTTFGAAFADTAKALVVGQWSDLVASELGVHLVQRIA